MNRIALAAVASSVALVATVPMLLASTGRRSDAQALPKPPAGAESSALVDAANAFAATLSAEQRAKLQTDLSKTSVSQWSNFPVAVVARNGIQFGALNAAQTAAAIELVRLALGEDGYARFEEIRKADDYLAKDSKARNNNGGGGGPG
ncbi:DUF3500 domain-containing protein, partial [bacterium]